MPCAENGLLSPLSGGGGLSSKSVAPGGRAKMDAYFRISHAGKPSKTDLEKREFQRMRSMVRVTF